MIVLPQILSVVIGIDKAQLLILLLAPLAPFGRHVNAFLLFTIALSLVLVHAGGLVFGWRVYGVEDERGRPGVDELMLRAGWYDDEIAGLDVLVDACDGRFALAGCKGQNLVDGVLLQMQNDRVSDSFKGEHNYMRSSSGSGACSRGRVQSSTYLVTNLPIHRYCHEHQLAVQPCPQYPAKVS